MGAQTEDLTHTPAERAAAAAVAAAEKRSASGEAAEQAETKAPRRVEEAALFAAAPEAEPVAATVGDQAQIVVIGAGLVGSLCAVVLLRKGFKVVVYERYPDIRSIPSVGRSINLSVTSRGLRAVRSLGGNIYEEMLELATKIRGRIIHMPNGARIFQRYGKDDTECNYSISRVELNKFLIDVAAREGAEFHFGHQLSESSDFAAGSDGALVGCTLHFTRGTPGEPEEQPRFRLPVRCPVIACDGAGSRVRYALRRAGLTTFTEDVLPRGYKEVLFPNPGENHFGTQSGGSSEECHGRYGLHIWPRGEHMLMALSNRDGSFTGTIYLDNEGAEESFEAFTDTVEGRARCEAWCEKNYAAAVPLVGGMASMVDQITTNPTGILGTVWTSKWAVRGAVLLIGDACHAMVPFFGQGCNCGFEDVLWLSRLLDKHCGEGGRCTPASCSGENVAACFEELERERKPSAEAICDMAKENFVEMRDKTGDVHFQAMKKIENRLENVFPTKFRSRYAMVCYGGDGNVSYANAKGLGVVQAKILETLYDGLCKKNSGGDSDGGTPPSDEELVAGLDLAEAERLIDQELAPEHRRLAIDLSTVKH